MFVIVGNSGSGKDSLIREVLENYPSDLPTIYIPKRDITRPPSPETEDFVSVTEEEFKKRLDKGEYIFYWHTYNKSYGVNKEVLKKIEAGTPVLVNVSRSILKESKKKYDFLRIIFVYVPFEITAQRIKERAREAGNELEDRLERAKENQHLDIADFTVDNTGELEVGGKQLLDYMVKEIKS